MSPNFELLTSKLKQIEQKDYPHESRIHLLSSYSNSITPCQCYVKREDELSFGICGSKFRKYRTLIPFLLKNRFQEVAIIGSSYSNHVLGISQLLIENQISAKYFLKGTFERSLEGNGLFNLMFASKNQIEWISKLDWPNVMEVAEKYVSNSSHKVFLLPEGGKCESAFLGSLSLALDILRNEKANNIHFDHIFIDSGTGLTASALIVGLSFLTKQTMIHVMSMAESESAFSSTLSSYHQFFCQWIEAPCPLLPYRVYLPKLKRFAKTNLDLFKFIIALSQTEGFLTDPIYSGKLFLEAKSIIDQSQLKGNILIIHSGGALSLTGFLNPLRKTLTRI